MTSKILKGIKLNEATSEYGANLDLAAGKAAQDTNEPQKYAIEVGPNKYVGDIYTDWNQADAKRKELAKKYVQVKVVPISKMNEDSGSTKKYTIKKSYTMSRSGEEKAVWNIMYGDEVVDTTSRRSDAKFYADKWNASEKESANSSQKTSKSDVAEGINISNELKKIRSKSTKELDNLILFYTKALEFNPKFQQNRDLLDLVKMVRQERKRMNKQGMAESSEEKKECGNCNGSGRMVWDADIGTDQECFACDGTGYDEDDDEKDDIKEGADIEYIVVIRDEQGKRSIRISALTPTDAKEKAESQGYKVIKVKDPSDSHYFNFKEGSVTSTFKIGPKSEYDKGKADSYYRRGDRSDQSPDPKEYLRGYDENDDYKDWGRDDPVDEGSSNILKGISRMVKGKPTPGAEYQKYFDAYKKAMQTGDKAAIANTTRDLKRIEKVAGPAFFEENSRSSVLEGIHRQKLNLKKIEAQFGEIKLEGGIVRNNQPLLRFLSKNNIPSEIFDHLIEQKIGKVMKDNTITESIDKTDKNLNHIFSQFNNFSTGNNVKVGDSVSALSLEALSLSNNTIELTGFLKPQSITNINNNYIEFESGETFPKQKIIQTKMWRQVIFFHNVEQAKKCLTVMSLNSGKMSDWEFTINNSLTESAIHEGLGLPFPGTYEQERGIESTDEKLNEKWSQKYKSSINCSHPKGFSQKAHCAGKKKHNESIDNVMEMTCPDCGMCKTHGDHSKNNLEEACWKGYHKEGNKKMFGKTYPNCVKNEDVAEATGDKPFDTMMTTIKQGTTKQKTKDRKEQQKQTQQRARDAFGNMFGGGNPADKLSIREQDVTEESCPHCAGPMFSEALMMEKKDACYYKVKSRYKVWPSAYASGALVKCRNKGASNWGNGGKKNESSILEGIEQADESLHDWFNKEKWVRMDTKGKIKGPCAREPGEGKPKCLPQSKAHSLGKKGRASAAARKRREDPNPDRSGKAINVNTKKEKND